MRSFRVIQKVSKIYNGIYTGLYTGIKRKLVKLPRNTNMHCTEMTNVMGTPTRFSPVEPN